MKEEKMSVFVTGMSVRFPESNSVEEFKENLFNGNDMVTCDERRWPLGLYGLPKRSGKLKDLSHFDADFFGITDEESDLMDPQVRLMLEVTFEALVDSGLTPSDIRGKRTGVFFASFFNEVDGAVTSNDTDFLNYRQHFARHINYVFDLNGPATTYDTACSSAMSALTEACTYLRSGQLDTAIVVGCNVAVWPGRCLQFLKMGMLSPTGRCAFLDESADGFCKAEAVGGLILQSSGSRLPIYRNYCEILAALSNTDGYKEEGITFPKSTVQLALLRETYAAGNVDPNQVKYIEAHGTGTQAGDTQEIDSLYQYFFVDNHRQDKLLVGSVKTNMGHCEALSGLASLVKVIISMEESRLPPNLLLDTVNPKISPVVNGDIVPVVQVTDFDGEIIGIDSFGFGGSNNHVIVKKGVGVSDEPISERRLVCVSGRTHEAVRRILLQLSKVKSSGIASLLDNLSRIEPFGERMTMPYRGYFITNIDVDTDIVRVPVKTKPKLVFLFAGLGCQFDGMFSDLMNNHLFRSKMNECCQVVDHELEASFGFTMSQVLDGQVILTENDPIFGLVGLLVYQICTLHVMTELGLHPDLTIGFSIGELMASYSCGMISLKELLLSSIEFCRLLPRVQTGMMVAVGMSKEKFEENFSSRYPTISVTCDNTPESITIGGPSNDVTLLLKELDDFKTFYRPVKSCGQCFHSMHMMKTIQNDIMTSFSQVFSSKTIQSTQTKMISTSMTGNIHGVLLSTYFANNLTRPVIFRDACTKLCESIGKEEEIVVIEISPKPFISSLMKGNFQAIRREGHFISGSKDGMSCVNLLKMLGSIYNYGFNLNLHALYPRANLPMVRIPSLSSQISWKHDKKRLVRLYPDYFNTYSNLETSITIDLSSQEWSFLSGHQIDGRILFPATGYLWMAWTFFAKVFFGKKITHQDVTIKDFTINRACILSSGQTVRLTAIFGRSKDHPKDQLLDVPFVVTEGDSNLLVSGFISKASHDCKNAGPSITSYEDNLMLSHHDVYRELNIRGYEYRGTFKSIKEVTIYPDGIVSGVVNVGQNGCKNKSHDASLFIPLADSLLQLSALSDESRGLMLPTSMSQVDLSLRIDMNQKINATYDDWVKGSFASGISFLGCKFMESHSRKGQLSHEADVIESVTFSRYFDQNENPEDIKIIVGIVLENKMMASAFIVYMPGADITETEELRSKIVESLEASPDGIGHSTEILSRLPNNMKDVLLVVVNESVDTGSMLAGSFILSVGNNQFNDCIKVATRGQFHLFRKVCPEISRITIMDIDSSSNYSWLTQLQSKMNENNDRVWIRSSHLSGIIGLVTGLRQEPDIRDRIRCLVDLDGHEFDDTIMKQVLATDLVMNIRKEGHLGSLRHIPVAKTCLKIESKFGMIDMKKIGDLTSFQWVRSKVEFDQTSQKTHLCRVAYSSLNFKDVMIASGKLPLSIVPRKIKEETSPIGIEFSGWMDSTRRVMGILPGGAMATHVLITDEDFLWSIPDDWSLKDAATIPVVYATAYYAMVIRGKISHGESILIHSGSGGVGQAAIAIALSMGCRVITSVGSLDKRKYLKNRFPSLSDNNFVDSRSITFEAEVLTMTNGRGVDIVLNSLAEEKLQGSLRCLANNGRFLEIGKYDLTQDNHLDLTRLTNNQSFEGICLDQLSFPDYQLPPFIQRQKKILHQLIDDGMKSGVVRPLDTTVFTCDQIEGAFRFMASGRHVGKVVVDMNDGMTVASHPSLEARLEVTDRLFFYPTKSYVVIGGLGGFALELIYWMVRRGARIFILTSRSGVKTSQQKYSLDRIKKYSSAVDITLTRLDVSVMSAAQEVITTATSKGCGSIGGIFNLAMVLRDGLFINQTAESFSEVCSSKISATSNLDKLTKSISMDHFVCFSSVSSGKGIAGQSNYAMANSFMERICETRRKQGLPGLAIQWGQVGDVGVLARKNDLKSTGIEDDVIRGTKPQRISSCLHYLELMMLDKSSDGTFCCYSPARSESSRSKSSLNQDNSSTIISRVAHILGIRDIEGQMMSQPKQTLIELGIDSLMTIEVKQVLELVNTRPFTTQMIRMMTVADLIDIQKGLK